MGMLVMWSHGERGLQRLHVHSRRQVPHFVLSDLWEVHVLKALGLERKETNRTQTPRIALTLSLCKRLVSYSILVWQARDCGQGNCREFVSCWACSRRNSNELP